MTRSARVPAEVKNFTPNQETAKQRKFQIIINDSDPKESHEHLIAAITNSLRWYALSEKRIDDDQHAIVLIDLLKDLQAA